MLGDRATASALMRELKKGSTCAGAWLSLCASALCIHGTAAVSSLHHIWQGLADRVRFTTRSSTAARACQQSLASTRPSALVVSSVCITCTGETASQVLAMLVIFNFIMGLGKQPHVAGTL